MWKDQLIVGMSAQQEGHVIRCGGIKISLGIADHQTLIGAQLLLGGLLLRHVIVLRG